MDSEITTLDKRIDGMDSGLESIINKVVIKSGPNYLINASAAKSRQHYNICVYDDGTVTVGYRECKGGVLILFLPKRRTWHSTFTHPLVDKVSYTIREITNNNPSILNEEIIYDVYLGGLIPLGEVTANRVTILTYIVRREAIHELYEEAKQIENKLKQKVPEVTKHNISYLVMSPYDEKTNNNDKENIENNDKENIENIEYSSRKIGFVVELAFPSEEMIDLMEMIYTNKTK